MNKTIPLDTADDIALAKWLCERFGGATLDGDDDFLAARYSVWRDHARALRAFDRAQCFPWATGDIVAVPVRVDDEEPGKGEWLCVAKPPYYGPDTNFTGEDA